MTVIKSKKLKNGFTLPVLGMGTWLFGGRETRDPANDDAGQIRALRAGIDAGFNLIDTAEYYADGYAEELTGQAIRGIPRESLFLTSKVWKTHLTRQGVFHAAEESLRRLGTDYLDLYLYHQVSDEVPLEETIPAMNELIDRGLVRHIGVSNFAVPRLRRAMACSQHPITVNQVQYSLTVRETEEELLSFCQAHDVILQAWRPLRGVQPCPLSDELCQKYRITLQQLALAWLMNQEQVTTLTGMRNPAHLPENRKATEITLEPEEVERLRRDMPGQTTQSRVPLS